MTSFPVFLSIVVVTRNRCGTLEATLTGIFEATSSLVSDLELVVVDNASEDDSVSVLRRLTDQQGLANLQVYALTKEVDADTASWVGLENALGDFVAVFDPQTDDIGFLPEMLDKAVRGTDVVFAENELKADPGFFYRLAYAGFNAIYQWFGGIHLAKEAPRYRVLSKRVVNFILQHPQPALSYRHLPATGGFNRVNLHYRSQPRLPSRKRLGDSIDRGLRLLVSTTIAPMRLVTALSLFGAVSNLLYSVYVVAVAVFKEDVAPGWISLSLQQSGMFLLVSLVLLVLGEYILQMAKLSNEGPLYHVAQEFTSVRLSRQRKLNVEEAASGAPDAAVAREMATPGRAESRPA